MPIAIYGLVYTHKSSFIYLLDVEKCDGFTKKTVRPKLSVAYTKQNYCAAMNNTNINKT
jgi:hypothetical protein